MFATRQVCIFIRNSNIGDICKFDKHSSLIRIERVGDIDDLQPISAVCNIRARIRYCDFVRNTKGRHLADDFWMLRYGRINDLQARRTVRHICITTDCYKSGRHTGRHHSTSHRHRPRICNIHDGDVAATCDINGTALG